jgi:hypothetical protein
MAATAATRSAIDTAVAVVGVSITERRGPVRPNISVTPRSEPWADTAHREPGAGRELSRASRPWRRLRGGPKEEGST